MRVTAGPYSIFTRTFGASTAPPVVLVHGYIVSSRYMVPTARLLAPTFRVYAPDLPGWGRSGKPAHALDLPQLSGALALWAGALGLSCPTYIANSFGCQVVTELACRRPSEVGRLVLLGPTIDAHHRTILQQGLRLALDMTRERSSLWRIEGKDLGEMGIPRALETLRVMMDDRIEQRLPEVPQPTLVIRSSEDPIVPMRWAEEVAALLPDGRLAVIPNAPHAANYSAPQRFVAEILPFIRGPVTGAAIP